MISLQLLDFCDSALVLDTCIAYHICNLLEILAKSRRLMRGILHNDLFMLDTTPRIMNVSVSKRKRDKVKSTYL